MVYLKYLPKYLNIVSPLADHLDKLESTSRPHGFFKPVGNNELKFFHSFHLILLLLFLYFFPEFIHRHYDRSLLPVRLRTEENHDLKEKFNQIYSLFKI